MTHDALHAPCSSGSPSIPALALYAPRWSRSARDLRCGCSLSRSSSRRSCSRSKAHSPAARGGYARTRADPHRLVDPRADHAARRRAGGGAATSADANPPSASSSPTTTRSTAARPHARSRCASPRSWFVLDTPQPDAAVCGDTLMLSRGLLESRPPPRRARARARAPRHQRRQAHRRDSTASSSPPAPRPQKPRAASAASTSSLESNDEHAC